MLLSKRFLILNEFKKIINNRKLNDKISRYEILQYFDKDGFSTHKKIEVKKDRYLDKVTYPIMIDDVRNSLRGGGFLMSTSKPGIYIIKKHIPDNFNSKDLKECYLNNRKNNFNYSQLKSK